MRFLALLQPWCSSGFEASAKHDQPQSVLPDPLQFSVVGLQHLQIYFSFRLLFCSTQLTEASVMLYP